MKIIDKYVVKSFLIGYAISFCVLIGLRVIIDLFVNLDEFAESADLGLATVLKNIFIFYSLRITLYFRDFAGMITVMAAAFSLGKMIRNNELVAIMSSGVSLKRVIAPIMILAILLTGVLVIDQELLIPPLSDRLVRGHDDISGHGSFSAYFISDNKGSLISIPRFDVQTSTMYNPTIYIRRKVADSTYWDVIGRISADKAVYDDKGGKWIFSGGQFTPTKSSEPSTAISDYSSDITSKDIPVRRKSRHKTLLSWRQLSTLAKQPTKVRDMLLLISQMHFHITEPIINLIMLMICLPVLVCRDPKMMKSAVSISFAMTGTLFLMTFLCKLLSTEIVFGIVRPEFWAWVPVFVFLPIAVIQFDSMKT